MKFLITGSSGFIGYHLSKRLLECGHDVVGIDNHNDYYKKSLKEHRRNLLTSSRFKFYLQDINKLDIAESDFDFAINLAAQAGVRVKKNKEHLYEDTNIKGFESFCKFCEKKQIQKIIYASSSSIYSDEAKKKFLENKTKTIPKSKYGLSKIANENFASKFSKLKDISFIGLRFFSVYGPLGRPDMAYFSFANAIKNNQTLYLNNKGKMYRDMTYIDDAIQGIVCTIKYMQQHRRTINNEIFNIGNDSPISTLKLLETLENKLKSKALICHVQTENESQFTHADITKSKNLLGYEPEVCLEDGIKFFLKWFKTYEH